jgi:hypothetical protein
MQPYIGASYRVSVITARSLAALQHGEDQLFSDRGVQSACVLPRHVAAWAKSRTGKRVVADTHVLFSIFDETVPQKNLATPMLVDHVVAPPGTLLRLDALRVDREQVIAHFCGVDEAEGPVRDLYSGALRG